MHLLPTLSSPFWESLEVKKMEIASAFGSQIKEEMCSLDASNLPEVNTFSILLCGSAPVD